MGKKKKARYAVKKGAFIRALAVKAGFLPGEVGEVIDAIPEVLIDYLREHGRVDMPGVGHLKLVHRSERVGVHPQTRKRIVIPATISVSARVAKTLQSRVKEVCREDQEANAPLE